MKKKCSTNQLIKKIILNLYTRARKYLFIAVKYLISFLKQELILANMSCLVEANLDAIHSYEGQFCLSVAFKYKGQFCLSVAFKLIIMCLRDRSGFINQT